MYVKTNKGQTVADTMIMSTLNRYKT